MAVRATGAKKKQGGTVNMRTVAKAAGVSPGTVSRVLSNNFGQMNIPEETREKIRQVARELNYVPNINAQRLFRNHSGVLGMVLPQWAGNTWQAVEDRHMVRALNGINQVVCDRAFRILLIFATRAFIDDREYLALFRGRQVDGIFIWGATREERFYHELGPHGYPHVFVTTCPDDAADASLFIRSDYAAASREPARALLERGHRRIAWCAQAGGENTTMKAEMRRGLAAACADHGLTFDEVFIPVDCSYLHADGYAAARAALDRRRPATALLTVSHGAARGAYDGLRHRDRRVPEDYALACCDSLWGETYMADIARSEHDDIAIGSRAAERLLAAIDGDLDIPAAQTAMAPRFLPGKTI